MSAGRNQSVRKFAVPGITVLAALLPLTQPAAALARTAHTVALAHSATQAKSAASSTSGVLDINTVGKPQLAPLPALSSEAKWAILNFRQGGPYADGTDFAKRVCSRVTLDFGPTVIRFSSPTTYTGFKCIAVASGTYWANGGTHAYAIPVEVTGSAVVPPAPPFP